ncbi:hypothetical protein LguiA_002884 [Lonicera macranthoides]
MRNQRIRSSCKHIIFFFGSHYRVEINLSKLAIYGVQNELLSAARGLLCSSKGCNLYIQGVRVERGESSHLMGDDYHHWGGQYDVFLSFRGEDIRKTFIDHLYSALERSGIYTFKDDVRLERGESIAPALLKAIDESMIAVVVFSKNYASSRWCLEELAKIMDRRGPHTLVIPIFYDVHPTQVRNPDEQGYFGDNIISQHQHHPAKLETWRKALKDAGNLSGYVLNNTADGHEAKFIDIFVQYIWSKLPDMISSEDERLVGMKSRIEEVTSLLLDVESDPVRRIVGIWGLSGIGKSTLAKAVFRLIKNQFQAACFLEEVGEESKRHGVRYLLEKQLSQLLKVNDLKINNECDGDQIMRRLRFKSVLLVLDDVDHLDQLDVLAGKHRLFGPGSRIIITTRNRQLLVAHGVDEIYQARLLDNAAAIRLFSQKAFKDNCPTKGFEDLSYEVIHYAGGLPLVIKVLGSALCGENLTFWKASLQKLRKQGPHGDILKKLKIGYDGLDKEVQETFLDIACFFEGQEQEHLTRKLDSFDFYPDCSIPILVHRSLIYISKENKICMHQLIQEMGRHMDREKPRRLWRTKDVVCVLKSSKGIKNIEGIVLRPHKRKYIDMAAESLRKMRKLRILEIGHECSVRGSDYLPSKLKWLIWDKFPSKALPPMFEAVNLIGLELSCSSIEQPWKDKKVN